MQSPIRHRHDSISVHVAVRTASNVPAYHVIEAGVAPGDLAVDGPGHEIGELDSDAVVGGCDEYALHQIVVVGAVAVMVVEQGVMEVVKLLVLLLVAFVDYHHAVERRAGRGALHVLQVVLETFADNLERIMVHVLGVPFRMLLVVLPRVHYGGEDAEALVLGDHVEQAHTQLVKLRGIQMGKRRLLVTERMGNEITPLDLSLDAILGLELPQIILQGFPLCLRND